MTTEFLVIGRVLRPHGVRGELLLETLTAFPGHLAEVGSVYLGEPPQAHPLQATRLHRGQLLIALADCPDRDSAEQYRGQVVQIPIQAAAPRPPGRYYQHELIGLRAVTDAGEELGTVAEILDTGSADVYVVRREGGEILLPAIRSVIREISLEQKRILVHLIDGLR
jgi:16S rRNA processing protein RimM